MIRRAALSIAFAVALAGCRPDAEGRADGVASPSAPANATAGPVVTGQAGEHVGHDRPKVPVSSEAAPAGDHAGMDMATASPGTPTSSPDPSVITIDERGAVLANVTTAIVKRQALASSVTAAGRVTYDEARLARVTAWVDGRIQRLHVSTTGAPIRKGQPIADIYGPDLVATQQELIMAQESARALAGSKIEGVAADSRRLVAASRRRLQLWGLSNGQIAAIERRGRPLDTLPILSPASGIVIRRMVQSGDWVVKGSPLFEIADLSRVWVEADVYETELAGLRPGLPVTVDAVAFPGEPFRGRVAFVAPTIASETRTNTVRIELPNPGGKLKPDMLVNVKILLDRGHAIVVPTDAVVDTGKRRVVWVQRSKGTFEARDVVLGAQSDEGYEIRRGLREGERIATSGGFMLDASSQLDRGGGAHAGHGSSTPRPNAPASTAPASAGQQP